MRRLLVAFIFVGIGFYGVTSTSSSQIPVATTTASTHQPLSPLGEENRKNNLRDAKDIFLFQHIIRGDLQGIKDKLQSMPNGPEKLKFINTTDKHGTSAIAYATIHGHPAIVKYLLQVGAVPCTKNSNEIHVLEALATLIKGYKSICQEVTQNSSYPAYIDIARKEKEFLRKALMGY